MRDLDLAKNRLLTKDMTLVIVKNGDLLFETKEHKIKGFFNAIETLGSSIKGASIADKVVGKAIALLCAYVKATSVYAFVLSQEAKKVFKKHHIFYEYSKIVKEILNLEKNHPCPFEMKARDMSDPREAYFVLIKLF